MLDQFKVVRGLTTRVGEGVRVVPLDPYLPDFSTALYRDQHHGPASLEQAVTADHDVPDAELSQSRASDLRSPVLSFRGTRRRGGLDVILVPCSAPGERDVSSVTRIQSSAR